MKPFLIVFALLLAPAAATASDPPGATFAEATLARYETLASYCDEVELDERGLRSTFRRCFTRDGRYKVSQQIHNHWKNQSVWWGDGSRAFAWFGHTEDGDLESDHYAEESPPRRAVHGGRPEGLPANVLSLFQPTAGEDRARAAGALGSYALAEAADGLRRFEHRYATPSGSEVRRRLWIRESDGLVSRAVESWGDQVHREATLKSASLNLPRIQMDLDHVAPASDRYSLAQRPWQFTVGLAGLAFGSGFFVWFCATAVAITKGRGVRPARWPRIWKWYSVAAGFAAAGLGLLALLSLPGGGHPPPIVFVMIFAIFAALGFLALAMFLLGGQLGRSIAVRRFSSAPSAPPA